LSNLFSMKKVRYTKRPSEMTTARQRFQFVVKFAAADLTTLRPEDWGDLQDELNNFFLPQHADLHPGGVHLWPDDPRTYGMGPEDFRDLQAETRDVLLQVIASRDSEHTMPDKPFRDLRLTAPHAPAWESAAPGRHIWRARGSVRDVFFFGLYALLVGSNTATLAKCPTCDNVFLKKTNQLYCSRSCKNKLVSQHYRARQAAHDTVPVAASSPSREAISSHVRCH
jgi:hypothetical protein